MYGSPEAGTARLSKASQLTPKTRRAYQRVISGLKKEGGYIRFLTLTSSPESPVDIQKSWHRLRARLDRRKLATSYIRVQEYTKKGRKHLHVLFRGDYIEQALLKAWWTEIHKASIVDIRVVRFGRSPGKMASEMAKYMSKPGAGRLSWSWTWVWRGFARDWTTYKRWWRTFIEREGVTSFKNCILGWDWIIQGKYLADFPFMLAQCRHEQPFDMREFFPLHIAANGHTTSRPSVAPPAPQVALTGVIS